MYHSPNALPGACKFLDPMSSYSPFTGQLKKLKPSQRFSSMSGTYVVRKTVVFPTYLVAFQVKSTFGNVSELGLV